MQSCAEQRGRPAHTHTLAPGTHQLLPTFLGHMLNIFFGHMLNTSFNIHLCTLVLRANRAKNLVLVVKSGLKLSLYPL